ncbi:hypothetical protein EON76_03235 [bacterium]|nr:MAG: hypothetical protein EON76_03235 [bacterium]
MDIIWNSLDLTRIVVLLGAVLALLYKKKFGITPGGIIVPGTLAYILSYSTFLFFLTVLLGILYYCIHKITFDRYAISKQTTTLLIMSMSVILGLVISYALQINHLLSYEMFALNLITPGLIALSAIKYKLTDVILGTLSVTFITLSIGLALAALIPFSMLSELSVSLGGYTHLGLDNPYVFLPLSILVTVLMYFRFGVRSGGYLIAPYVVAVIYSSPIQGLMLLAAIAFSYIIVKTVQRYSLLIGLERFVFCLFVGYILATIIDLIAAHISIPGYRVAPLILMSAIAVITNDLTLHTLSKSFNKGLLPSQLIANLARWAY